MQIYQKQQPMPVYGSGYEAHARTPSNKLVHRGGRALVRG